jgi:hypothetical protein
MLSLVIAVLLLSVGCLAAHAATFYVATTGSNAVSCTQAQSSSTPRRTINQGIACLSSGDTLIVGDGIYDEIISDVGGPGGYTINRPPSGTSWTSMTTIKAAHSRGATLKVSAPTGGWNTIIEFDDATTQYIQIEGFVLDGEHKAQGIASCVGVYNSHHIRFKDVHFKDADQGIQGTAYDYEILASEVSGHGYNASGTDTCAGGSEPYPGFCHGFYMRGSGHLFDGLHVHHNSGNGFQLYASNCTVRNTFVHDNKGHGIWFLGSSGTAYNNVVVRNCGGGIGFGGGTNVANSNTITNQAANPPACVSGYLYGITTGTPNTTTIKNNLITNIPSSSDKGYIFAAGGTGATGNYYADNSLNTSLVTGNLCDNATMVGCTYAAGSNSTFFVDATTDNYHICTTSPARNAGATLGSPYNVDKDGIARPTTGAVDIGAYQYVSGTVKLPLPAPSNLRATVQ